MKKILLSTIAATALVTSANAGMVIDVEAGAGVWNAAPSGEIRYGTSGSKIDLENTLGLESSTNTYLYLDIDHFVPIVPNVKVERQELKVEGTRTLGSINFGGNTYNASTKTTADLTQNDFIFYWGIPGLNLATAGIVDVSLGLDIKQFDGSVQLSQTGQDTIVDLDYFVPMGYVAAKIDPPLIPASISASLKQISYKDSGLKDMMAKISIDLPLPLPLIDIKADIGYKEQSFTLADDLVAGFSTAVEFKGMFFGISAKF